MTNQQTKCTVTYADGTQAQEFDSIQQAAAQLLKEYPQGVIYDAGGDERDESDPDENYDVRSGRVALIWASESESVNDNGSRSVAEIMVA